MLGNLKGRGTPLNPANRFEPVVVEPDPEWLEDEEPRPVRTSYFEDHTRSVLSKNDSPDIPFTYSLNPYRGCEHGCIYCYARPTHEYLGFSSGLDFETKILIKREAPRLLAQAFQHRQWTPQTVALCGNTDCYQLIERKLGITRRCLQVFLEFRNPVGIITKNALIQRDIDILQEMAALNLVFATVSITTLDNKLVRKMEPRTSAPEKRLETIARLAAAGIPTGVSVAPVIPGLTDHEMPAIISAAVEAGATRAGYVLLRLPYAIKDLFADWLTRHYPDRAAKVLNSVRDTRQGKLSDPCFGSRMKGAGERAETIAQLFELSCKKYGLSKRRMELSTDHFRRRKVSGQEELFGS